MCRSSCLCTATGRGNEVVRGGDVVTGGNGAAQECDGRVLGSHIFVSIFIFYLSG